MSRTLGIALLLAVSASSLAQTDSSKSGPPVLRGGLGQLPVGASDSTTLSFRDTDLRDIFRALSVQHGVNVFLDNGINKRVTVSLNRVRVYDAIAFLASQNGLECHLEGGIFRIVPPPPPEPPPPPAPRVPLVGFEKNLLSVDLRNDELESVISQIQQKCQKNILVISGTTGTVSGKLMDVDFAFTRNERHL
jgi:type II secretory pathway component GspD/PulD (secretin)